MIQKWETLQCRLRMEATSNQTRTTPTSLKIWKSIIPITDQLKELFCLSTGLPTRLSYSVREWEKPRDENKMLVPMPNNHKLANLNLRTFWLKVEVRQLSHK